MPPLRRDAASVEHQNAVGVSDSRQAMGNHQRGPAGAQAHRGEHNLLGDGVQRRRRLVEDQDRRVLDDGARDAQPLTLAAGQTAAGLGNLRVVLLRQPGDELVRVRGFGRRLDVLVARVEPPISQVVANGSRK